MKKKVIWSYIALKDQKRINKRDIACDILEAKRALNLRLLNQNKNKFI